MTYSLTDGATTITFDAAQSEEVNGDSGVTVVPSSTGGPSDSEVVKLVNSQEIQNFDFLKYGDIATLQTIVSALRTFRGDSVSTAKKCTFTGELGAPLGITVTVIRFSARREMGNARLLTGSIQMQVVST